MYRIRGIDSIFNSPRPCGLQHARLPCPSPSPGGCLKLIPIESMMPSNCLILCHPLLLPPSIFPNIRVFSNESVPHIRWLNYWSFSFNISSSNEYSGLISFSMEWLECSPIPQFKSINSLVLSFLYSPTLTSIFILPVY